MNECITLYLSAHFTAVAQSENTCGACVVANQALESCTSCACVPMHAGTMCGCTESGVRDRGGSKSKFEPKHDVRLGLLVEVFGPKSTWFLGYISAIGDDPKKKWRVQVSCPTTFSPTAVSTRSFSVRKNQLTNKSITTAGACLSWRAFPPRATLLTFATRRNRATRQTHRLRSSPIRNGGRRGRCCS